jgi:hypothetical protein
MVSVSPCDCRANFEGAVIVLAFPKRRPQRFLGKPEFSRFIIFFGTFANGSTRSNPPLVKIVAGHGFVPDLAYRKFASNGERMAGFRYHNCLAECLRLGANCRSAFSAEAAVDALPDSTSIIG